MRLCAWTCAAALWAVPASAQDYALVVDLLPGHPVHHEAKGEAGVVMALSVTPDPGYAAQYRALCEELRVAAGLGPETGDELRLEVIFIVPYKGMAVEGYYLPADGGFGSGELVQANGIARDRLDGIVARAGIPPQILDETEVDQQVSCQLDEPVWHVRWDDVRRVDGEEPVAVIERAHQRFMAVHQSVVEHNGQNRFVQKNGQRRPANG